MQATINYEHDVIKNGLCKRIVIRSIDDLNWHCYVWDYELGHWRNWGVTVGRKWNNPEEVKTFLAEKGWTVQ